MWFVIGDDVRPWLPLNNLSGGGDPTGHLSATLPPLPSVVLVLLCVVAVVLVCCYICCMIVSVVAVLCYRVPL